VTELGPGDRGYLPQHDSLLRRLRAEGARAERVAAEAAHHVTVEGRRRYGLRALITTLALPNQYADDVTAGVAGPFTDLVVSVSNAIDTVEVAWERDDDEPDELPVRLFVADGGDSTSGWAYLTPEDAYQVAAGIVHAADLARHHAEQHPPAPDPAVEP
jgi:hypothetical protein